MATDPLTIAIVTGTSTLIGVALSGIMQTNVSERNRNFELKKERLRFENETFEKRVWLVREKIEKAHLLLSEIDREFSLTFLTIDWSAKMSPDDFDKKYRTICVQAAEVMMIADLYAPSVSDSVEELYGLMNCYWGHFRLVLYQSQQGDRIDLTTLNYQEALKYSRQILTKVFNIKRKIGKIADSIIST